MFDVKNVMNRQSRMETERSGFDALWRDVAELEFPRQYDNFNGHRTSQGNDRQSAIFDEYCQLGLDDATAIFEGFVMPKGSIWQYIKPPETELMKYQHVRAWYEAKTLRLFELRNDPRSGFVQESNESAASLIAFGNQCTMTDLRFDPVTRAPIGLRYRSEHIGMIWIEEDWQGLPVRWHRKLCWTAEQARAYFGARIEQAPKVASDAADPKKASNKHEFLQIIELNPAVDASRDDWRGKPYTGAFLSCSDKEFVQFGGFGSSPLTYSRFARSPNETYGRGPGMTILPAVKAAQQVMLDLMVAAEMSLMPPLGVHDDLQDQMIQYAAREVTYGAIDSRGNSRVQKLFDVGDMNPALAIQEQLHKIIDRAFFRDMLNITKEMKSHVTDSQLYERLQEKGILLAPLARQESEWFSPQTDREIDLMSQMGEFDDMPGEVREAGGVRRIVYDNPLNRAQKAEAAGGYFRALEKVTALAQAKPEVLDIFFAEYPLDKAIRGIAEIEAIPAAWAATDDEKRAAQAEQMQRQQAQDLLAALPVVGKAANDFAQAGNSNVA